MLAGLPGIEGVEQGREFLQHGIDAAFDGPQRMVGGHDWRSRLTTVKKSGWGWDVPRMVI
jgi:hypothetical protein